MDKQNASHPNSQNSNPIVKYSLTVTAPTKEFDNLDYLTSLINTNTSYQVIPSSPRSIVYDPDSILIAALPFSEKTLIDIALPFLFYGSDHSIQRYFARYLLFRKQLIGIRLCSSSKQEEQNVEDSNTNVKWPRRKWIMHPVSKKILKYYHQSSKKNYRTQVPIGEFILSFKKLKIGLLFESELNENTKILQEYNRFGCQILSVLNNVEKDLKVIQNLSIRNINSKSSGQGLLNEFKKTHKVVVMYAGVRMAPTPSKLFACNPHIAQEDVYECYSDLALFNQTARISVTCSLSKTKEQKGYDRGIIKSNLFSLKRVHINESLWQSPFSVGNFEKKLIPQNNSLRRHLTLDKDVFQKMYVWYLYTAMNGQNQFILSYPLTDKWKSLYECIKGIAEYINVPLKNMVNLYKNSEGSIIQELNDDNQIYSSLNQLMKDKIGKKKYFYVSSNEEFKIMNEFGSNEDQNYFGNSLISEIFSKVTGSIKEGLSSKVTTDKLEHFCNSLLEMTDLRLEHVFNKARSLQFTKENILYALNNVLKKKIKSSLKLDPFFSFILRANESEIKKSLIDAESNIQNNGNFIEEKKEKKVNVSIESFDNDEEREFAIKMKQIKKIKQKMKSLQCLCHKCNIKLEKEMGFKCSKCSQFFCYQCLHQFSNKRFSVLKDLKSCLKCQKLCHCKACTGDISFEKSIQKSNSHTELMSQLFSKPKPKTIDCQSCEIEGRKPMNLQIQCMKCYQKCCYTCVYYRSRKHVNYSKEWYCFECVPPIIQVPIEQVIITEQKLSENFEKVSLNEKIEPQPRQNEEIEVQASVSSSFKPSKSESKNQQKKSLRLNKSKSNSKSKSISASASVSKSKKSKSKQRSLSNSNSNSQKKAEVKPKKKEILIGERPWMKDQKVKSKYASSKTWFNNPNLKPTHEIEDSTKVQEKIQIKLSKKSERKNPTRSRSRDKKKKTHKKRDSSKSRSSRSKQRQPKQKTVLWGSSSKPNASSKPSQASGHNQREANPRSHQSGANENKNSGFFLNLQKKGGDDDIDY